MNLFPILIAEDDENDAFLLRRAFTKAGVRNPLQMVKDGSEVLSYLKGEDQYADREQFPFPGLLLLDLKMPRLNGLEALSAIREDAELRRMVVILLSSSNQERDINEAFDLRANSYLAKPHTSEGLLNLVNKLKEYWLNLNQFPNFCPQLEMV